MTASNINGESVKSNVLTTYIAKEPDTPAVPVEESITIVDETKENLAIRVSWQAPVHNGAPITGY